MRRTLPSLAALILVASAAPTVVARAGEREGRDVLDGGQPIVGTWRSTGSFSALAGMGPDKVVFESGPAGRVRADGDAQVLERLRFIVRDGRLYVGRRHEEPGDRHVRPATIHVSGPAIRAAITAGSGGMTVDRLSGGDVEAMVAGSGTLGVGAIDAETVTAKVAGSGALTLAGRGRHASIVVAGSGRVEGRAFTAGSARTVIAGSGEAAFRSPGQVDVTITGSGSVAVNGGATCKLSKIGSGTLRCG